MKTAVRALTVALGLLFAASAFAEAPPPAVKTSAEAPVVKKDTKDAKDTKVAKPAKTEVPVAPGGGDGKVWVNHKSKIYHCEGAPDYGKTKDGEYLTEADAKAKGNKAKAGKACSAAKEAAKDVKPAKEAKEAKETKKVDKAEKAEKAEKTEKPAAK